jgi:filamentous hemagglutinin family protein
MRFTQYYFIHLLSGLGVIGLLAIEVRAQSLIVPDNTLGNEGSIVESRPGFDAIKGGATRETGLFHSFSEFGVGDRATVNFLVTPQIQNIFARVTGPGISDIQGSLGTRIDDAALSLSTASLFLLNPNGIVFGPNARLDLAGSFLATTASSVKFGDRAFSAIDPQVPLLTVSVPMGLGFGQTVGDINIDGAQLSAGNGKTLAFIGGDVKVSNNAAVFMSSGNIHLGAIEASGSVGLQGFDGLWTIDDAGTSNFRNIILDRSLIVAVGDSKTPTADIFLTSKNLTLQNDVLFATLLKGDGAGGNIKIRATGDVLLQKSDVRGTNIFTFNQSDGVVRGGNISIEANSLTIADGASISPSTSAGSGKAGNIEVNLRGPLTIAGEYLYRNSDTLPTEKGTALPSSLNSTFSSKKIGDAGNIVVYAQSLRLENGGQILLTNGGGKTPGIIDLRIGRDAVFSGATTQGYSSGVYNQRVSAIDRDESINSEGILGVRINAQSLLIDKGAKVSTYSAIDGNSRDIEINISDKLTIRGEKVFMGEGGRQTAVSSRIETEKINGIGNAGKITLRAGTLEVLEGGSISSDTSILDVSGFKIPRTPNGVFQGQSGAIDIIAKDTVVIDGYGAQPFSIVGISGLYRVSQINSGVSDSGFAQGGNVSIQTKDLAVTNGGQILTNTGSRGNAGNISVVASGKVLVAGNSGEVDRSLYNVSRIASETRYAIQGDGGNISIVADLIELKNGGALRTSNVNSTGDAGSISLTANRELNISGKSQNGDSSGIFSTVTTSSSSGQADIQRIIDQISFLKFVLPNEAIGNGGTIAISTPVIRISDGGEISALNSAQGRAGSIAINLSDRLILNNSNIQTRAEKTSGGDINITSPVILLRNDSNIKTQVGSGAGSGGNINLIAKSGIVLLDDSDLLAFARDGQGGNISLFTRALLTRTYKPSDPASNLETLDTNGFVDINATGRTSGIITLPELNPLQNNRTDLNPGLIDTNQAISRSCLTRNPKTGKFVITGAGGIPPNPGDPPLSNYSTLPVGAATSIAEADNLYTLANGQVVIGKACQTMGEKS